MRRLAWLPILAVLGFVFWTAFASVGCASKASATPMAASAKAAATTAPATLTPVPPSPTASAKELEAELDKAWASEDWAKVGTVLETLHQIDPTSEPWKDKLYVAYLNQSKVLTQKGDRQGTDQVLARAIALAPDRPEARALISPTATPVPPTPAPTKPVPPSSTPPLKVGDVITAGNWKYTVTKTDRQKQVQWTAFGNTFDAKGIWQIINVQVENIGKQTYAINTWDFEVRDGGGVVYKAASESGMYARSLKLSSTGEDFPPGVPAELILLFDVNPAATGLKLNLVQAKVLVDLDQ